MFLGKTPLEALLERENERLRAELAHYKHIAEARSDLVNSVVDSPKIMEHRISGDTLKLAILAGADLDPMENGLHVYCVDRCERDHFKIGYFISRTELLQKRDRAFIMQDMIEQVARHIQDKFLK